MKENKVYPKMLTCPNCNGSGVAGRMLICSQCHGSGEIPRENKTTQDFKERSKRG